MPCSSSQMWATNMPSPLDKPNRRGKSEEKVAGVEANILTCSKIVMDTSRQSHINENKPALTRAPPEAVGICSLLCRSEMGPVPGCIHGNYWQHVTMQLTSTNSNNVHDCAKGQKCWINKVIKKLCGGVPQGNREVLGAYPGDWVQSKLRQSCNTHGKLALAREGAQSRFGKLPSEFVSHSGVISEDT